MGDNSTSTDASSGGDARQQIADFVVVGLMIVCLLWIPCVFLKCRYHRNSVLNRQHNAQLQAELERVRESLQAMFREEVARTVRAASSQRTQERKAYIASKLHTKTLRFPSSSSERDDLPGNVTHTLSQCGVSASEEDPGESNEEDGETCAICLNEYRDGEEVSWSRNESCNHQFHQVCITEWLLTHEECPCCRHAFLFSSDEAAHTEPGQRIDAQYEQTLGRGLELFNRLSQLSSVPMPSGPSMPPSSLELSPAVGSQNVEGRV